MSQTTTDVNVPASAAEMGPMITQLRDLHLPDPVSWWPLAPGWWLVGLCVLGACGIWIVRRYNHRRPIRFTQTALNHSLQQWRRTKRADQYLGEATVTLKRFALTQHPKDQIAGLTGQAWSQFLEQQSRHQLSDATLTALNRGAYERAPAVNVEHLHQDLQQWVRRLRATPHA